MTKILFKYALVALAVALCCTAAQAKPDAKGFTVVLDPGHGGKDFGAVDNRTDEKSINLGVALELRKLLEKKLKDCNVVMTRDDDRYLTLQERADVANKAKGNLFVSIHTNSVDKSNRNRKSVSGASVYALGLHKDENNMRVARRENSVIELEQNFEQKYSGFDPQKDESYIIFEMAQKKNLAKSINLAKGIQNRLVAAGRNNRGVHQAGFWVLWATSMPAVLVELDFICNPTSAAYLSSAKGQKELAGAIFDAIEHYIEGHGNQGLSTASSADSGAGEEWSSGSSSGSDASDPPILASAKNAVRKTGSVAQQPRYYSGKRRRRSDLSRQNSSVRNYETDLIVVHSEDERLGRHAPEEAIEAQPEQPENEIPAELTKEQKKARKKREKEEKKAREKEKKQQRPANAHNAKVGKIVTVYKIQVLASAELLRQDSPRFRGLSPISTYKENNLYKYYYGESQDRKEIEALLQEVRKKIPDAFVVSSMKSSQPKKQ